MVLSRIGALALLALASLPVHAAPVSKVIDVPTSAGAQRILEVTGDVVNAYLLALPGGNGFFDIRDDGSMPSTTGACSPIGRNMWDFANRGTAVVMLNSAGWKVDEIIAFLRTRHDVPIWLSGGSSSANAAVSWAASLPPAVPIGLVAFSPPFVPGAVAAQVKVPSLVMYHVLDVGVQGTALAAELTAAPVVQLVSFTAGNAFDCGGHHLFAGEDAKVIDTIDGFIDAYSGMLGGGAGATKVPVVEYFNASQGHYFMTADADEIAGLDGGAYGGALERTGQGFNAYSGPSTGTVPVCRFFTTPGRFGAKGSHFYTANAAECDWLKGNPDWIYEKIAFYIGVPVSGACPAGTAPVYRAFNHGQTGAPNHRFTTDVAIYDDFTTNRGWDAEGIAFCSPP